MDTVGTTAAAPNQGMRAYASCTSFGTSRTTSEPLRSRAPTTRCNSGSQAGSTCAPNSTAAVCNSRLGRSPSGASSWMKRGVLRRTPSGSSFTM